MSDFIVKFVEWLKSSPVWTRYAVPFLLAAIAAIYLTSCGAISRIEVERSTVRDIQDTTHVRISQRVTKYRTSSFGAKRLPNEAAGLVYASARR